MRLRLDSGFTGHRKVMGLGSRGRRWTWLEILVYTCDHGNPEIPANIGTKVPGASKAFLADCEQLSLIDRASDGTLFVHDWRLYNGSIDERVNAYLDDHPKATANEVQSQIQGRRDIVLAAVKKARGVVPGTGSGGTVVPGLPVPEVVPIAYAVSTTTKTPTVSPALSAKDAAPSGVTDVYEHWRVQRGKTRSNYDKMSPGRRAKIQSRLREFTIDDLCLAIDGVAYDPWADRSMHDDLTIIFRSREQVERFLEFRANANGNGNGKPPVGETTEAFRARIAALDAQWRESAA